MFQQTAGSPASGFAPERLSPDKLHPVESEVDEASWPSALTCVWCFDLLAMSELVRSATKRRFQFLPNLHREHPVVLVELLPAFCSSSVLKYNCTVFCVVQPAGDARDVRDPNKETAMSWLSSVISAPQENRSNAQLLQARQVRLSNVSVCCLSKEHSSLLQSLVVVSVNIEIQQDSSNSSYSSNVVCLLRGRCHAV